MSDDIETKLLATESAIQSRFLGRKKPTLQVIDDTNAALFINDEEEVVAKLARLNVQGFSCLGFSMEGDKIKFFVWSKRLDRIFSFDDTTVTRRSTLKAVVGIDYLEEFFGDKIRDDEGRQTGKVKIRYDDVTDKIISGCTFRGPFAEQFHVRDVGVWPDEDDDEALVINCKSGLFHVKGTEFKEIQRSENDRHWIYLATEKGSFGNEEARLNEVLDIFLTIQKSWNWRRKIDPFLVTGWVLNQAYLGVQDARPSLYLTGPAGSGKSYLETFIAQLLGPWALHVTDGRGSSPAGIKQLIGTQALTLIIDELEQKVGATETESSRLNQTVKAILQVLRSSYSQTNNGSLSAVKGSQSGKFIRQDTRVCAMIASIALMGLEAADRNRMIRVAIDKIERNDDGELVRQKPEMPNNDLGGRVFRRMWSRWATFEPMKAHLIKLIKHPDERMRVTFATSLASLFVALDLRIGHQNIPGVIDLLNVGLCEDPDETPADWSYYLNRLLSVQVTVTGSHMLTQKWTIKRLIATSMLKKLNLDGIIKGGTDDWIVATSTLHTNGLATKYAEDRIWLFMADNNVSFDNIARSAGASDVIGMMRSAPGAVEARNSRSGDTRHRIDGQKCRGIWVPLDMHYEDVFYSGSNPA